jgi:hypothetical protein
MSVHPFPETHSYGAAARARGRRSSPAALTRLALLGTLLTACGEVHRLPAPLAEVGGADAGSAGAGTSGGGGAAASNASGGVGGWVSPIAPEISQRWSWSECGRITPDPAGDIYQSLTTIRALAISKDGSLLLSNIGGLIVGWQVGEPFETSQPLWSRSGGEATNVALSPDGRFGTFSGDVRAVFDAATGEIVAEAYSGVGNGCLFGEFNFSPDGRLLAGKQWSSVVDVFETETFTLIGQFETRGCAQGIAFTFDSKTVAAPDGRASVENLRPWMKPGGMPDYSYLTWTSLTRAPDGSFVEVTCPLESCKGRWIRISDEGHWHLRAGILRHVPSGEERVFDSLATEAVFAPNGDIIAGEDDATLIRFCRNE